MDCFRERGPVVMTSGSNHANGGARAIIGMRSAAVRVLIMRTCAEIDHAHMRGNFRFLQGDGTANRVSSTVGSGFDEPMFFWRRRKVGAMEQCDMLR